MKREHQLLVNRYNKSIFYNVTFPIYTTENIIFHRIIYLKRVSQNIIVFHGKKVFSFY